MSNLSEIFEIMNSIKVKQMILQGPPGTSKTHGAKEIVLSAIKEKNIGFAGLDQYKLKEKDYDPAGQGKLEKSVYWDMVQFHPSYGYEDFVRGITVSTNGGNKNSSISYSTVDKIFGRICKLALHDNNKGRKFFLIIDEINRADIATVFGELIYALEYRDCSIATPYKVDNGGDRYLTVPENLYIIGTMNTADKSVGTIDMAIRRRFLFVDQLPEKTVIENHFGKCDKVSELKAKTLACFDFLKAFVDKSIRGNYKAKDFEIGHTYFLPDLVQNPEEEIKHKIKYQVLPMLREYVEDKILMVQEGGYEAIIDQIKSMNQNADEAGRKIEFSDDGYRKLCFYLNGDDACLDDVVNFLMEKMLKKRKYIKCQLVLKN